MFVHGIGTQPACETFLDWSGPITSLLRDWRTQHGITPADPVLRCQYDLTGVTLPFLELDVPAWEGHNAQTLVMTEAWWAATTRAPGLGSMTTYVSRALPRIMDGIKEGYRLRAEAWQQRLADTHTQMAAQDSYAHRALVLEEVRTPKRDWVDALDWIQKELTIFSFGPALLLGRVILAFYAPFRAVPIKQLQDFAALKTADNMLTRWFGELPDIIDDPIQAANVRARLANAIGGLRGQGCGKIIVVAHSGGVIVSFTTLVDPAYADLHVDKLLTLGEGLALAWRIEDAYKGAKPPTLLSGNLRAARPDLHWTDFWSTYDPAPAGPLQPPPGVTVADRSHMTINRMSILEDHGSYWNNDEEFLIPLLQHLDTPNGLTTDSRFFQDQMLDTVRLSWRRDRVAVLALWRWIAALGAGIPIVVTTATGALSSRLPGPGRLGGDMTGLWSKIPGHQLVGDPLDAVSKVASFPGILLNVAQWALGSLTIVLIFMAVARIGVGRWSAWDAAERTASRQRVPVRPSRLGPMLKMLGCTALCAAISVGMFALLWR